MQNFIGIFIGCFLFCSLFVFFIMRFGLTNLTSVIVCSSFILALGVSYFYQQAVQLSEIRKQLNEVMLKLEGKVEDKDGDVK